MTVRHWGRRVTQHSADTGRGVGGFDDALSFQWAIDQIPDQLDPWPSGNMGSQLVKAPQPESGSYVFRSPVTVPADKLALIMGEGPFGAPIINDTGGDYLFIVEGDPGEADMFEMQNLALRGGSVLVRGRRRTFTRFKGVDFTDTPKPAIEFAPAVPGATTGADRLGPVRTIVDECDFYRCAGGVWHTADTYLLWLVQNCYFKSMRDAHIVSDGPGGRTINNRYQGIQEGVNAPNIWLRGNQPGTQSHMTMFLDNHGGETITADPSGDVFSAPRSAVWIGDPTPPATDTNESYFNVKFRDVEFHGSSDFGPGIAEHAVSIWQPPTSVMFDGTYFSNRHETSLIEEAWAAGGAPNFFTRQRNFWGFNTVQNGAPPVFDQGGIGWLMPWMEHGRTAHANNGSLVRLRDATGADWDLSVDTKGTIQTDAAPST